VIQGASLTELNRVLGGGLVRGSIVLIGGEPGIGKSTLLLQAAAALAAQGATVLYTSGEESTHQIKLRAERLDAEHENLLLSDVAVLEQIQAQVEEHGPDVLIIDSIQTVHTESVDSSAGQPSQIRECGNRLQQWAKPQGLTVFVVGHITKSGRIAGPKTLEHMVDTVLYLEGDRNYFFRLLRSVKNRFGPTSEVGVFDMRGDGLHSVSNPNELFLAERMENSVGSAIAGTLDGTRTMLIETQALCVPTNYNPRRTASGLDLKRTLLIAAVLTKHTNINLSDHDIYVKAIGGVSVSDPGADLALALALASSYYERPLPGNIVCVGELGLSGELRAVAGIEQRIRESLRMGFDTVLAPVSQRLPDEAGVVGVRTIGDAVEYLR